MDNTNTDFDTWCTEVDRLWAAEGYPDSLIDTEDREIWYEDYYEGGDTPQDVVDLMIECGL